MGTFWQDLRSGEIKLELRVLGFTLLVSILTGVVFGIAPATQAFKTNVQEALKDGGSSVGVGVSGSLALTRFIAALLFEVQATDTANLAIIAALLTNVSLLACFIPVLRATRVDPMIALRHE
jgi:ABC-type lipoprotein release transport system permease subunit